MSTNVQPNLLEMPEIVMDNILENLEFRSIMNLRKVCHPLRDYIDEKKPEGNITLLYFNYSPKSIFMKYKLDEKEEYITYKSKDNGCSVYHKKKEIQMNNVSMEEIFFQDFKNFLKFQRKELEKLCIFNNDHEYNERYLNFLTKMGETISKFSPLKVKNLDVYAVGVNSVLSILQSLAPGILNILGVYPRNNAYDLELPQIIQLEQWKQLEEVEFLASAASPGIEHFLHLSSATLYFETISVEELAAVKEAFLHRPHMKEFYMNYANSEVEHQFEALVGRAIEENQADNVKRWFFRIPGTGTELLYIVNKQNEFKFRRIDESETNYPIPPRE